MVYTNSTTAHVSLKPCRNPVNHIRQAHLLSTFACRSSFVEDRPSKSVRRNLSKFVCRTSFVEICWSYFGRRSFFVEIRSSKFVRRSTSAALDRSLASLGPLLGLSWPLLGRSWPLLARSWCFLKRFWPVLGRSGCAADQPYSNPLTQPQNTSSLGRASLLSIAPVMGLVLLHPSIYLSIY